MTEIASALIAWKSALGADSVRTDLEILNLASKATFATNQKIAAILYPKTVLDVSRCLEISNRHKISLYPVSRGRNCGYGSKVPYVDKSVLLDLSGLNKISNYREDLACITLQAGVTQEQLFKYLSDQGRKHWMDPISTFSDCSVVGNILERGHGMTPYADRVSYGCDFEVVLPNGEVIRTGLSGFGNARAAGLDRWAPGPSLEGLFSQSNFGIVTEMTVWLMPAPEYVRGIGFSLNSTPAFEKCIEALRPLSLNGTLKFGPRFFNEYRILQTFTRYPYEQMKAEMPISPQCLSELRTKHQIPLWTGLVGLYGSKEQVAASERLVQQALLSIAENVLTVDGASPKPSAEASFIEKFLHSSFAGMSGIVSPVTQRPRWRVRSKSPSASTDWSEDECGIIWCPVSSPFVAKDTQEAIGLIRSTVGEFGFEPDMSVSAIRERTLEINASIVFDRADPQQELMAVKCANELLKRLAAAGFYPHRVGLATQTALQQMPNSTRTLVQKLKHLFDPEDVLAVGRYVDRNT